MDIIHGNDQNFNTLINDELVLVDFFATWCGPCQMLGPVLEELSNDRAGVKIVKIDIDQNEGLARQYGIMSVPTLMLFKNGNPVGKKVGYIPKQMINNWIEENRG